MHIMNMPQWDQVTCVLQESLSLNTPRKHVISIECNIADIPQIANIWIRAGRVYSFGLYSLRFHGDILHHAMTIRWRS